MVTNLPEAAKSQWKRVVEAKTPEEKLEELKKFLSLVPKHKGTKNLIKQCKRQMAKLREEIEERRKRKTGVYVSNWVKSKHGEARIGVLGFDQSIIYELFNFLSHKNAESFPYWLYEPYYSIYEANNIQFQLVALPPLGVKDSLDYKIYNYLKTCDFVIVVFSDSPPQKILEELAAKGIKITSRRLSIDITKLPSGGIRVIGPYKGSRSDLETLLRTYRIYNAVIKLSDEATLEDIENAILDVYIEIPGILVQHNYNNNYIYYRVAREHLSEPMRLDKITLLKEILDILGMIRIYTSPDGKEVSERPVLIRKGATVHELAGILHKDLQEKFRYAYIVREGVKIKVSKHYVLSDGDIVHICT